MNDRYFRMIILLFNLLISQDEIADFFYSHARLTAGLPELPESNFILRICMPVSDISFCRVSLLFFPAGMSGKLLNDTDGGDKKNLLYGNFRLSMNVSNTGGQVFFWFAKKISLAPA
jgi:hypothetical protein